MAKTFAGGVHPPESKHFSERKPFVTLPLPSQLICLLSQHLGKPAKAVVQKNAEVKRGQIIGEADGFVSCAIHAPTSGKVVKIEPALHPLGRRVDAIIIEPDGKDIWAEGLSIPRSNIADLKPEQIIQIIKESGIVGMGGATFPSHVKLSPPKDKPIDTLIINAVECEPYLTCDHQLMLNFPKEIIQGAQLIQKALGAKQVAIGIEANKPDAFNKMKAEASHLPDFQVYLLPVKYPQGAEKQLIKAVLNREVPAGGLPMDVGVVVHNVMTTYYIFRAVYFNEPLTERYLTVTGDGVAEPQNLLVRIGTPMANVLEFAKAKPNCQKLISGGPMMGIAQFSTQVPVTKGSSGILLLEKVPHVEYRNCIRCGSCVEHCPMHLLPNELSVTLERRRIDLAQQYHVMDCMECGACAYVCPANRPIVQWIKFGKAQIIKQRQKNPPKK